LYPNVIALALLAVVAAPAPTAVLESPDKPAKWNKGWAVVPGPDGEVRYEALVGVPTDQGVTSDKPWDGYLDIVEGHGFVAGDGLAPDGDSSIGFPAAAHSVIAVGAHRVRLTWPTADGPSRSAPGSAGSLAVFSGRGPSRDPAGAGFKPDLVAPGEMIVAALSQHATDAPQERIVQASPGGFAAFEGTSMASPFVAGVVALMLQADGGLTPSQVRTILRETASTEGISQALPDAAWGYGRLDAAAAVARAASGDLPAGGGGDVQGGEEAGGAEADDEEEGGAMCAVPRHRTPQ
jgi:subtilisin family serine protease